MLHFFRKYERYLYAAITFVVVITFSFFGTYNEIAKGSWREETAFQAVDGSTVSKPDLQNMVQFIGTDGEDKLLMGGIWGPNFLNDGVIKENFLRTGLAEVLVQHYQKDLNPELQRKLEREKRYALYTHPQAKFLGVDAVWTYLAPDIKTSFDNLRLSNQATDSESFSSRVQLYLGETKLPPAIVRNVLRYQERQYSWVTPDPNLERIDLSLFGYHTAEDWFGNRFIQLVAQFIINSAKIAEQRGYVVTKSEALADLVRQAETSFQQNRANPHLGLASSRDYLNEQLRRMGMDQGKAVQVWRQVLLFRRLFNDMGNSVFIDPMTIQQMDQFDNELIKGDLYRLPPALRINDWHTLQKFEVYLDAIAKRDSNPLSLPVSFRTVEQLSTSAPELIQKNYLVEIAEVDKKSLQGTLGIKETWNWEVGDGNWEKLKKQFPELAKQKGETKESRFEILDNLDQKTRSQVDAYARSSMLEADATRIEKALQEAKPKKIVLGLRKKGGNYPIAGLKKPQELIDLLNKAPLKSQENLTSQEKEADAKLKAYTANGTNYYRIAVLEKAPAEEIMTFEKANQQGVLDDLLNKTLENYYSKIKAEHPGEFQNDDKTWKEFIAVQDKVAELYFAPLLKAISADYEKNKPQDSSQLIRNLTPELSAPLRFYAHARNAKYAINQSPEKAKEWAEEAAAAPNSVAPSVLRNQWKLVKEGFEVDRDHAPTVISKEKALKMNPNQWSPIQPLPNGDIYFYYVKEKGIREGSEAFEEQLNAAHQLLSADAQQALMRQLLSEMIEKRAITLDYLNRSEEIEPEQSV